jgi:DNA-binding NtrC family response regulator
LPLPIVSNELEKFIQGYDWPGNVRQLRNVAENMLVMCQQSKLGVDDLSHCLGQEMSDLEGESNSSELRDMERLAILESLKKFSGNRTLAAEALGISVRTLQRKLKLWGMIANNEGDNLE